MVPPRILPPKLLYRGGLPMRKKMTPLVALKRYWQLYLFLLIPLAYIITFKYAPMVGIQLAFKNFEYDKGLFGSPWIGLRHFQRFFGSYIFARVLVNTLRIAILSMIFSMPFPILFALLLNSINAKRYKKIVQTITYIPHFISTVVLVGMLMQLFNPNVGVYGVIYKSLTGTKPADRLPFLEAFFYMYIGSGIWKSFGWGSIVYLAALTNVPPELYEAAEIDGASRRSACGRSSCRHRSHRRHSPDHELRKHPGRGLPENLPDAERPEHPPERGHFYLCI